jgi:hypothetical protein
MKIQTKYIKDETGKDLNRQSTDYIEPFVIPCNTAYDYDMNRYFANKNLTVIPFTTQKSPNGKDNWVYFDLATEEWIYTWLSRIVLEYTHKVNTFPTALSKLDQTINKKGTYDRLNSFNTVLTTCSGLVLNKTRATEIKFTTKQLADIEKVFDIATYVFRDTRVKNAVTEQMESSVLSIKDIGYHRDTKEPNKDISRIYFSKNTKLTIAQNGDVYDNSSIDMIFGEK